VVATLLGAEEFGFATAPLVVLGCIMMRVCHLNTCPVGVATQDPRLREKFTGDAGHVGDVHEFIAAGSPRAHGLARLPRLEEMVGTQRLPGDEARPRALEGARTRLLRHLPSARRRSRGGPLLPDPAGARPRGVAGQDDAASPCARPRSNGRSRSRPHFPSATATAWSAPSSGSEITRRYGPAGLPDDTIRLTFQGSAGQSFGAFIPRGLTLTLEGDANDYVGKGLSGGRLVISPPRGSSFVPEQNMIVGNVALYGATSGEAFIYGAAGERFAVRNSGVHAVVEAVGDHGCEYMTGGRVVVLGPTGRNFAAGMSGGIAYVLDEDDDFAARCNKEMVLLYRLRYPEEIDFVKDLVFRHAELTGSARARKVLVDWDYFVPSLRARGARTTTTASCRPAQDARDRPLSRGSGDGRLRAQRRGRGPGGRQVAAMGKPTGFLETGGSCLPTGLRSSASRTGTSSTRSSRPRSSATRARAAWTAARRSATPAS
jgi:glutamate synthase (ferredoxin)